MEAPREDHFILTKLKIQKNGGLVIEWKVPYTQGEGDFKDGFKKESQNMPHPDLTSHMNDLVEPVTKVLNMKIPKPQNEDDLKDRLTIEEINISGELGEESAQFSFCLIHKNSQRTRGKTAFIKLKEDTFGVESKLWSSLENLTSEAYEYVWSDKYAQLTMFPSGSQESQDDE